MSTSLRVPGLLGVLLAIIAVATPARGQLKGQSNEATAQRNKAHLQTQPVIAPKVQKVGKVVVRGGREEGKPLHLINAARLGKVEKDLAKIKKEVAVLKVQQLNFVAKIMHYKGYSQHWAHLYMVADKDLDRVSSRRRNSKAEVTPGQISFAYKASCVAMSIFALVVIIAFIAPSTRNGMIRFAKSGMAIGSVPTLTLAWHMPELLGVYPAEVIEWVYAASVALPGLWLVLAMADWILRKKPEFISGVDPELNNGIFLWTLRKLKYAKSPRVLFVMIHTADLLADDRMPWFNLLVFVDRLTYVFWCDFKNTWASWFGTFLAGPLLFNHWFRWHYLCMSAFLLAAALFKHHNASKCQREEMMLQSEQATSSLGG